MQQLNPFLFAVFFPDFENDIYHTLFQIETALIIFLRFGGNSDIIVWEQFAMKLKARPGSSRKRLLVEREEKARKCVVIGSRNCSVSRFIKSFQNCLESSQLENEGTLRLNETTFVFWEGISKLKKSSLKQYLAYHGTQVLFFLINEADILVRDGWGLGRATSHPLR